jgi:hypothetical protein
MAWGNKYTVSFINQLGETIDIYFAFKDYVGASTALTGAANPLELNYQNSSEDIFEPIIELEAVIQIFVRDSSVSFEDFVTTEDDDIYVSILKDNVYKLFDGFVTLEEGNQPIKNDSPYTLTIRATVGLVLLKGVPFTDQAGDLFTGKNTLSNT